MQNKPLACLAYMNGNITACINDGCADPFKEDDDSLSEEEGPKDMPANVDLVEVAIGKWPFVFVVTISKVAAGQLCADLEAGPSPIASVYMHLCLLSRVHNRN